jgi:hypothetical protein
MNDLVFFSAYEKLESEKAKRIRNRKCNKVYYQVIIRTELLLHFKIRKVRISFFIIKSKKRVIIIQVIQVYCSLFIFVHIIKTLK